MKNLHLIPTDKPSKLHLGHLGLVLCGFNYGLNTINGQHIYITSDEKIKEEDWVINLKSNGVYSIFILNEVVDYEKKIILTTDQDLIKDGVQAIDDEFLEWFVKNPSCEWVEYIVEYKDGYGNWYRYDKEFWDKNSDKPIFSTRYKIIIPQEEPKQYPIGGYAPGYYSCTCVTCKTEFMGDKRAVQCEPCAIEMVSIKIVENNGSYQIEKPEQETLEEAAQRLYPIELEDDEWDKNKQYRDEWIEGAKWQAERMYSEEGVLKILRQFNKDKPKLIFGVEEWFEQFKNK